MRSYLIEYQLDTGKQWQPVGIIGTDKSEPDQLLDRVRDSLKQLHNCGIRIRPFRRVPGVYVESNTLGGILIIRDEEKE